MSARIQRRQQPRRNRKPQTPARHSHLWRYVAAVAFLLLAAFGALAASNHVPKLGQQAETVPTLAQPATAGPSPNTQTQPSAKPKQETYLELDLSQGKGLFTAWRIIPSNNTAILNTGHVEPTSDLRRGDSIHMSDGLIALVTKAEKYVDPHPGDNNKPSSDGNVAERVVGWSKHITDTLLYLQTTDEVVKTTPEHPFFVHSKGWVKAGNLRQGDQIETGSTRLVSVVSTQVRHERQAVYNLDVENTHTFFVGKDKLLVHNGDCVPEIANPGEYLSAKAPMQVGPGTKVLEGQYVDDLGRVQPWRAHYDDFGRQIGRTDYNAANKVEGYASTHSHTYGYEGNPSGWGGRYSETGKHIPGEFTP